MAGDRRQFPQQPQQHLPEVPLDVSHAVQGLLTEMKARLEALYVDPTPPAPPTGTTATAHGVVGIILRWNPLAKANGFRIYRNTSADISTAVLLAEVVGGLNTYWHDTTTTTATLYYYWVNGINYAGVPGPMGGQVSATAP